MLRITLLSNSDISTGVDDGADDDGNIFERAMYMCGERMLLNTLKAVIVWHIFISLDKCN